jgi:hypothetical protein
MLKIIAFGPLLVVIVLGWASFVALKNTCSLSGPLTKLTEPIKPNGADDNAKTPNSSELNPSPEAKDADPSARFDLSVTGPNKIEGHYYAQNAERGNGDWGRKFLCDTKVGEFALAIFTLFLVIFTGLLWFATDRLVRGADDTAKRQLRAYVWAETIPSKNLDDPNFGVLADIKNSGQTPAYEVHTWSMTQPVAEPPPNGFVFASAPEYIPGPRYVVNPSSKHFLQAFPEVALTVEERLAIRDGFLILYSWGEIRYRDTFGENRTAWFRLRLVPEGLGGRWAYCDEGNDAD